MKKIIILLSLPLVLTACSTRSYTPIIESSFCYDVKYIMGDFCFNSNVKKENDVLTLTVLDTRAEGLVMVYDGQNIVFKKDDLSYSIESNKLDKTNPSIVIKSAFDYIASNLETCVSKNDNGFVYRGMIPIGEFYAYQNFDNKFYLIEIPNANIKIELSSVS